MLVGDVHPEVAEIAGALTPVPGGVGTAYRDDAHDEHAAGRPRACGRWPEASRPPADDVAGAGRVRRVALDWRHRHRKESRPRPVRAARRSDHRFRPPRTRGGGARFPGPGRRHRSVWTGRARFDRCARSAEARRRSCSQTRRPARRSKPSFIPKSAAPRTRGSHRSIQRGIRSPSPTFRCLYEVNRDRDFDVVIVVASEPETQIRRVMERDSLSEADARPARRGAVANRRESPSRGLRDSHRRFLRETERQVREVWKALLR